MNRVDNKYFFSNVNRMATGLSSPLGIIGIILIIIGIIMTIIGVILLITNQNNQKPWYIWLLLIGGIVIGIMGGIFLAIALSYRSTVVATKVVTQPVQPMVVSQPVLAPQPVMTTQYVQRPITPPRSVAVRQELVGQEAFDPDPQTYITETPQPARRLTVAGPYGPNGEPTRVSGVYKPPNVRTYTTHDVHEHPVTLQY